MPDVPVFTWLCTWEQQHEIEYCETTQDLGPGYEKFTFSEIAHTNADGYGTVTAQKGRMIIHAKLHTDYTGLHDQDFKTLLAFLRARKNANNEPFYVYNYPEAAAADPTGVAAVGRYLFYSAGPIKYTLVAMTYYDIQLELKQVF